MSGLGTLNERKQTLESYLYAEKALKSLGQSPDVSEQRAKGACSGAGLLLGSGLILCLLGRDDVLVEVPGRRFLEGEVEPGPEQGD